MSISGLSSLLEISLIGEESTRPIVEDDYEKETRRFGSRWDHR